MFCAIPGQRRDAGDVLEVVRVSMNPNPQISDESAPPLPRHDFPVLQRGTDHVRLCSPSIYHRSTRQRQDVPSRLGRNGGDARAGAGTAPEGAARPAVAHHQQEEERHQEDAQVHQRRVRRARAPAAGAPGGRAAEGHGRRGRGGAGSRRRREDTAARRRRGRRGRRRSKWPRRQGRGDEPVV